MKKTFDTFRNARTSGYAAVLDNIGIKHLDEYKVGGSECPGLGLQREEGLDSTSFNWVSGLLLT